MRNEPFYGTHGDSDSAFGVMNLVGAGIEPGKCSFLVPDNVKYRTGTKSERSGNRVYCGRFHFGGKHAEALPCLPFGFQLRAYRHTVG